MAKEVNLLSYWMPTLRKLREFREIANAEEPEIRLLLDAIERTLNNMFIEKADEYGIKHFEEMMHIYPEEDADLETRRFKVAVKWNDKLPYTESRLNGLLESLCGENGYKVKIDNDAYELIVKLALYNEHNVEEVRDLLDRVVPANMITEVTLFNTHYILSSLTHEQLSNYTYDDIRLAIF